MVEAPDDELEPLLDPSSPGTVVDGQRRRWVLPAAILVIGSLLGAYAVVARPPDSEDLACNGHDLFESANANVVVQLVRGADPEPALNSLGSRSFGVEQIMATRSDRGTGLLDAHVRFVPGATTADAEVFIENAELLPAVEGADLGSCPVR